MSFRIGDEEREIYNFAIDHHISVAELRNMLRQQGFYRKPHAIVVALRELRHDYGHISDEQYVEEIERDEQKALEYRRGQATCTTTA